MNLDVIMLSDQKDKYHDSTYEMLRIIRFLERVVVVVAGIGENGEIRNYFMSINFLFEGNNQEII